MRTSFASLALLLALPAAAATLEERAELALKVISYDRAAVRRTGPIDVVVAGPLDARLPAVLFGRALNVLRCPADPDSFAECASARAEAVLLAPGVGVMARLAPRLPSSVRYVIGLCDAAVNEGAMWSVGEDGLLVTNAKALTSRGVELDSQVLRRARKPAPTAAAASVVPVNLPADAEAPEPLEGNPTPAFPPAAKRAGREADVVLKLVVTAEGSVRDVEVTRGEPPFSDAAVAAVRAWRYRPALQQGRPIAVYRVVRVPFRLH